MVRQSMAVELRAAVFSALKSNTPVRREGLRLRLDGTLRVVNLEGTCTDNAKLVHCSLSIVLSLLIVRSFYIVSGPSMNGPKRIQRNLG